MPMIMVKEMRTGAARIVHENYRVRRKIHLNRKIASLVRLTRALFEHHEHQAFEGAHPTFKLLRWEVVAACFEILESSRNIEHTRMWKFLKNEKDASRKCPVCESDMCMWHKEFKACDLVTWEVCRLYFQCCDQLPSKLTALTTCTTLKLMQIKADPFHNQK